MANLRQSWSGEKEMNQGWKCYHCKRMNKRLADFCQSCGTHWEQAIENWHWIGADGGTPRQRSQSARRNGRAKSRGDGKGKGKEKGKDKGKDKDKGKKDGLDQPFGPLPTPFHYAPPSSTPSAPWPSQETPSPFALAPVQSTGTSTSQQELVAALRKAYVDAPMPPEVKELVEKHESSGTRQITKDLHSATTLLGRAQRALKDAQQQRQTHRNAWLAHLTESMQLWEGQLEEFKRRQMALREAEQKASQDIASARSTIQQLNQTSGTGQASEMVDPFQEESTRHRGGGTTGQATTDTGPVRVRCWCDDYGRDTFRCRRGRASTSKEGKVRRKGQGRSDGRPHSSNWLVTLGCFFSCPLVKGGSVWPKSPNDNVVEAYCDDFVSYSSAAGNIVITPDPWNKQGFEDFTNPFKAILNAQRLRSDVLMDTQPITAQPKYECRTILAPCRHKKAAKLSFSQEVELVLSFTGHIRGDLRTQIMHDQLQDWHQKPWSLRIAAANHHGYPHVFDRWCDSCDRKAPSSIDGGGTADRLLDESRARTSRQRELGEEQNRPQRTDRRTPRRDPGGESSLYPLHDWQDAFLRNEHLEDRTTRVTFYGIALDALRTQQGSVSELTRTQIILLARRLYPELYGWNNSTL